MKQLVIGLVGIVSLLLTPLSLAQNAVDSTLSPMAQQQIKLHEAIILINQEAIVCLKAGTSVTDCQQQFRDHTLDFARQQQDQIKSQMMQQNMAPKK